jgi:phosphomannomutase
MTLDSRLIVSVSGIRGIVGEGLSPAAALAFAQALGTYSGGGRIVVSRDGRPSGAMLRHAVLAGLSAAGCEACDLGVVPTATVGVAVRSVQAAGGIQITASHNPAPWNGLKLFGRDGRVLSALDGLKLQELFLSGAFRPVAYNELGAFTDFREAEQAHCALVLPCVDGARIQAARLRVLVDANGGAGGSLSRRLLQALGVETVGLGCDGDGVFAHEPEPTAANLAAVCPRVVEAGAHLGLALDPDADRLALIDERGEYIGEELTLALALESRLRSKRGPIVINMSTSRVCEEVAARFGCVCQRSAVGEANVADCMLEVDAVLGGEGNGGVIDPRIGLVRDPFIGMALILDLMAESGKKLSELVAELPRYIIIKDKYTVSPERLPALFQALTAQWPQAQANSLDGLRLDWSDRWVHVRPSNTEPIVRVIAEAPQQSEAEELCRDVGRLLQG